MKSRIILSITSGFALLLALLSVLLFISGKTSSVKDIYVENSETLRDSEKTQSAPLQSFPSFVEVVKKVKSAVVRVESTIEVRERVFDFFGDDDFWRRFFGFPDEGRRRATGIGSGFIISPDGYVLTNNHVIENAVSVEITTTEGKKYKAKIVGADKKSDVALLRVNENNLPYVNLGDSSKVEVGEWVVAIGNPFGDVLRGDVTVSAGIVSAKGRQLNLAGDSYEDFIQTDAAINRGNSGGPLVNMRGEVIGITSAILTPSGGNIGIGFAIPSNMAKFVIEQIKKYGRVIRGYLGITIGPVTEDNAKVLNLPNLKGALVNSVEKRGPADKAGIKRYDVIIEFDGQKIDNFSQLRGIIGQTPPNKKVPVKIIRDGKEMILYVTVGELEDEEATSTYRKSEITQKDLGIEIDNLTSREAREYGYPRGGVVITRVNRGSVAADAGLMRGDMILEVNRTPVSNANEFGKIISRMKSGDSVLLLIWREDSEFLVSLRLP
ncbi:MAG: Do family serine endopeptidase [Candidatus Aminicenantia bacterium]